MWGRAGRQKITFPYLMYATCSPRAELTAFHDRPSRCCKYLVFYKMPANNSDGQRPTGNYPFSLTRNGPAHRPRSAPPCKLLPLPAPSQSCKVWTYSTFSICIPLGGAEQGQVFSMGSGPSLSCLVSGEWIRLWQFDPATSLHQNADFSRQRAAMLSM
jgi:hypothetical protein